MWAIVFKIVFPSGCIKFETFKVSSPYHEYADCRDNARALHSSDCKVSFYHLVWADGVGRIDGVPSDDGKDCIDCADGTAWFSL
jgi:hypothetical protein